MTVHLSARWRTALAAMTAVALLWLSGCSSGDTGSGGGFEPPPAPPPSTPPLPQGPLTGDAAGLEEDDVRATACERERGRDARDSAADHHDVRAVGKGLALRVEFGRFADPEGGGRFHVLAHDHSELELSVRKPSRRG